MSDGRDTPSVKALGDALVAEVDDLNRDRQVLAYARNLVDAAPVGVGTVDVRGRMHPEVAAAAVALIEEVKGANRDSVVTSLARDLCALGRRPPPPEQEPAAPRTPRVIQPRVAGDQKKR